MSEESAQNVLREAIRERLEEYLTDTLDIRMRAALSTLLRRGVPMGDVLLAIDMEMGPWYYPCLGMLHMQCVAYIRRAAAAMEEVHHDDV